MAAKLCGDHAEIQFAAQIRANAIAQHRTHITQQLEAKCKAANEKIDDYWLKIRSVLAEVKLCKDRLVSALEQVEGKERACEILTPDFLRVEPTSYQAIKSGISIEGVKDLDAMDPQAHIAILESTKSDIDRKINELRRCLRGNQQPQNTDDNPRSPPATPTPARAPHALPNALGFEPINAYKRTNLSRHEASNLSPQRIGKPSSDPVSRVAVPAPVSVLRDHNTHSTAPALAHAATQVPRGPSPCSGHPKPTGEQNKAAVSPSPVAKRPCPSSHDDEHNEHKPSLPQLTGTSIGPKHTTAIKPVDPPVLSDDGHLQLDNFPVDGFVVEGEEFIFRHPAFGDIWMVLQCDFGKFDKPGVFTTDPFKPGGAFQHYNNDKSCGGHDTTRSYDELEMIQAYGHQVVGDEVNEKWVAESNSRLKEASDRAVKRRKTRSTTRSD